jgi:hypothetical protein
MNTILQYSTYIYTLLLFAQTLWSLQSTRGIMGGMTRRNILLHVFMATDKITGIECDLQKNVTQNLKLTTHKKLTITVRISYFLSFFNQTSQEQ